jgi:uncharacterized protein YjbI with pentapeptide repeats
MMRRPIVGTRFPFTRVLLAALGVSGTLSVSMLTHPLPALAQDTQNTVIKGCTIIKNPTLANHTNCPGVNLNGERLSNLDLSYANLSRGKLKDVKLVGAKLRVANLSGAIMIDANLTRAIMNDAKLNGADLRGADLTRAHMSSADLTNADLRGATVTFASRKEQIDNLSNVIWTGTTCPDGLRIFGHGDCAEHLHKVPF